MKSNLNLKNANNSDVIMEKNENNSDAMPLMKSRITDAA
jgi:hypothetical protein